MKLKFNCCYYLQIAGEGRPLLMASTEGSVMAIRAIQPGLFQTISNVIKNEGVG